MKAQFNEEWLAQAIKLEESVDCDISAGPNLVNSLVDYLTSTDGIFISKRYQENYDDLTEET
ncbi:hypothetical protein [Candidatus Cyanaurora vandensis]|uniref:hypothetical protein n=1 Tax=Candidatus Cyanaurora vandensis TaxID=2714958 RepID=UPI00257C8B16|nr:hypothetical protein [Candidatus Cyanaurora vandensis]